MFLARFSSKKETRFNYFSLFLQSLFRMSFTPKFSARKTIFHDSLVTIGKKKINPVGFNIYSYRKKTVWFKTTENFQFYIIFTRWRKSAILQTRKFRFNLTGDMMTLYPFIQGFLEWPFSKLFSANVSLWNHYKYIVFNIFSCRISRMKC